MAKYTITIDLTDNEVAILNDAFDASGKTIAQVFQEMWDGYSGQTGCIKAQVEQWKKDTVKNIMAQTEPADIFVALKGKTK